MIDNLIEEYHNEIDKYTKSRKEAQLKSSRARINQRKVVWWAVAIRSDEKINTYNKVLQDLEELKQQINEKYSKQIEFCKGLYGDETFTIGNAYEEVIKNIIGDDKDE